MTDVLCRGGQYKVRHRFSVIDVHEALRMRAHGVEAARRRSQELGA